MFRSLILKTLIANCGINALGLVNSILLAHWLGPAGRGEVAAALLWPMLLAYLSSTGLISATLYFSARPESRLEPILTNGITLAVVQSTAAFVIGYLSLPVLLHSQSADVIVAARWYLLVIPITLVAQYEMSILQGRLQMTGYNFLRLIIPVGYLAGTLGLAALHQLVLFNIVMLHVGLNLAVCIGALAVLFASLVRPAFSIDVALAKQMLKYGIKVQAGNVAGLANQSLDQAVMAAWMAPSYLGLYVVAVSSAAVSQVFAGTVMTVATPSITQRQTASERVIALQRIFRSYWLISFVLTLALAACLPIALPLVFGSSFKGAIGPAEVLLLGMFLLGAKDVLASGAQALGNPWLGSKAQIGALAVTGLLLYFLLPSMGIMGAAIATSTACGMQLLIVIAGLRRAHGIATMKLFRISSGELGSALQLFDLFKARRDSLLPDQS